MKKRVIILTIIFKGYEMNHFIKTTSIFCVTISLFLVGCSEEKADKEPLANVAQTVSKSAQIVEKELPTQVQKVPEKIQEVQTQVQEVPTKIKEEVAVVKQKTGAELYRVCGSCHGQKAQKVAMGVSQVIKGWEPSKTIAALQGYKDETYGGSKKDLMRNQVSRLSDEDMKRVAEYISNL